MVLAQSLAGNDRAHLGLGCGTGAVQPFIHVTGKEGWLLPEPDSQGRRARELLRLRMEPLESHVAFCYILLRGAEYH